MAADGIPFCEDFDQWRTRVLQAHSADIGYAEDAKNLMELSLIYIKQTDELNKGLHGVREKLRNHFLSPSEATRTAALDALDAFDAALDYAEPSAHADSLQYSWFPKPRG